MAAGTRRMNLRGELILAGIDELNERGLRDFSVRRVAEKCGVSCAAPYKHFKDKQCFVVEIIAYINAAWNERQQDVLKRVPLPRRAQIVEISLEYIRFLVDYPYFRSVIMLKDDAFDKEYVCLRGHLSELSAKLIDEYCLEVGMPENVKVLKTYIVRSLIYGAALMFDNGELDYSEENLRQVAYVINREFDLKFP